MQLTCNRKGDWTAITEDGLIFDLERDGAFRWTVTVMAHEKHHLRGASVEDFETALRCAYRYEEMRDFKVPGVQWLDLQKPIAGRKGSFELIKK